jgi:hypothetical protein
MYLGHRLLRIALFGSAVLLALSFVAWVQAVRLPDYANYLEGHDGWHVGVRNAGTVDHPIWWDTYAFVGQFPDRRVLPTPPPDMLVSPYRWPDPTRHEARLLWPLLLSFVAPVTWAGLRLRRKAEVRGFPVGT